jgi:hypothetical protein
VFRIETVIGMDLPKTISMLEEFIKLNRDLPQLRKYCETELYQANESIQDLEHYLELGRIDCDKIKLSIAEEMIVQRRKRRRYKDAVILLQLLEEWNMKNQIGISYLDRVLSDLHKHMQYIENRTYSPKTNIMDSIVPETEDDYVEDTLIVEAGIVPKELPIHDLSQEEEKIKMDKMIADAGIPPSPTSTPKKSRKGLPKIKTKKGD